MSRQHKAPALIPRPRDAVVPLTFSQQLTWRLRDLDRSDSTRSVAVATLLTGPLSPEALRQSFEHVAHHHEALRTRVIKVGAAVIQAIDEVTASPLDVVDATRVPRSEREREAQRKVEELAGEAYRISEGPMFRAVLVRLSDTEHVLGIAMDHLISDAVSIGILFRDLWTGYHQILRGASVILSPVQIQFADYASWQQHSHEWWRTKHGPYWQQRLAGARPLRPFAAHTDETRAVKVTKCPFRIGATTTVRLRELCRVQHTSLAMGTLAAFIASLAQWCRTDDVVVALVSMGRPQPQIRNTLGYFGVLLYLRVDVKPDRVFQDLLAAVTSESLAAHEHADAGYVAAQNPVDGFSANPRFNWIPRHFGVDPDGPTSAEAIDGAHRIEQRPLALTPRDDFDERGGAAELILTDEADGIAGSLCYRADRATPEEVERFTRLFCESLDRMAIDPRAPVFGRRSEGLRD